MSETVGLVSASSRGTQIDMGANDAKSSYVSLGTASADFDSIQLLLLNTETNNSYNLIDVAINGTTVIASNMLFRGKTANSRVADGIWIPYGGSSSDTIEVRGQSDQASNRWLEFIAILETSVNLTTSTINESHGEDTATSFGTVLDPGGTANTESSKVEIASSLTNDLNYINFCCASQGDGTFTGNHSWIVRIYTGGAGSEVDSGINFIIVDNAALDHIANPWNGFHVDPTVFASGTRVSATVQSTHIDATDRVIQMNMNGYNTAEKGTGGGGGGGIKLVGAGGGLIG